MEVRGIWGEAGGCVRDEYKESTEDLRNESEERVMCDDIGTREVKLCFSLV